jgi:hypothetical protein
MYQFVPIELGPLKVFRLPEPDMVYTMGGDTSTGLADDYSAYQILSNTMPFEQVAVFRAKWPVPKVTKFVDQLGRFYNEALLVQEINYPGNSVQDALLTFYNYPRNYQAIKSLETEMDVTEKYGFRTTEPSKWLIIGALLMAMEQRNIIIHDPTTFEELRNFVYIQSKSKAGAADGFNDDTVMALMFALHGANLYPQIIPRTAIKIQPNVSPDTSRAWKDFKQSLLKSKTEGIVM